MSRLRAFFSTVFFFPKSVMFENPFLFRREAIRNQPRATVNTITEAAPAALSARAHSFTVAPVVITSSTSTILAPRTRPGHGTEKTPLTLWTRWAAVKCVWVAVGLLSP